MGCFKQSSSEVLAMWHAPVRGGAQSVVGGVVLGCKDLHLSAIIACLAIPVPLLRQDHSSTCVSPSLWCSPVLGKLYCVCDYTRDIKIQGGIPEAIASLLCLIVSY
jgi:hypothetical protein